MNYFMMCSVICVAARIVCAEIPSINGPAVYGVQPTRTFIYRIPTSGDRPIQWQVKSLPQGVSIKRNILTGSLATPGRYPLTILAKNASGTTSRTLTLVCGDTIALTPPMGWNSWYSYSEAVSQASIEKVANLLVKTGLADYGYSFVNIDDCWQGERGGNYRAIQPNARFTDMHVMCERIHSLGLKVGIYSSPWMGTYAGFIGGSAPDASGDYAKHYLPASKRLQSTQFFGRYPGSIHKNLNHVGHWFFDQDVKQWADWGIDFVKVDWHVNDLPTAQRIAKDLHDAQKHRSIIFSMSNNAPHNLLAGLFQSAHMIRTTGDIRDSWQSICTIAMQQLPLQKHLKPGNYPDPDILQIGRLGIPNRPNVTFKPSGLSQIEQRTHMTMWAMLSAPLMISCDIEQLDAFTKSLLCDKTLLAINQDEAMNPAISVSAKNNVHVWHKKLSTGKTAIATFNLNDKPAQGLPPHGCCLEIR